MQSASTPRPETARSENRPAADIVRKPEGTFLSLSGDWTVHSIAGMAEILLALRKKSGPLAGVDASAVGLLDTAGALLINLASGKDGGKRFTAPCPDASCASAALLPVVTPNPRHKELLERSRPAPEENKEPGPNPVAALLADLGKRTCEQADFLYSLIGFWGQFLVSLGGTLINPKRLRLTSLVYHMEQTGLRAVPIVALLSFLIGMVISYMSSGLMAQYGTQVFIVDLLAVLTFREMAVIITAILVAGRSGSAFTAQLGSMMANEEVDAMVSMGINPMETLVLPRIISLMAMLPALLLVADLMAMIGGMVAAAMSIDLSVGTFIARFMSIATFKHFLVGMVKAPFFAVVIGLVGCFLGFKATGSAESVGRLTTTSVVESIFLVIAIDAAFAVFFMAIGV